MEARHFAGGYYLIGYAVECALKAVIAKQVQRYEFPDKRLAQKSFTHDLTELVSAAGLGAQLKADMDRLPTLNVNWAVVKDWSVERRYELGITEALARDMYSACTARTNGVLSWLRKHW